MANQPKRDQLMAKPALSPDELLELELLPISRGSLYSAIARGEIESFRVGKQIVIPLAPLMRKLGA